MNVDFLIIGQGIAGTLLSFELLSKGYSVIVIDKIQTNSASNVAGAVLNPIVFKGRKNATERNKQIKIAVDTYEKLGDKLSRAFIRKTTLVKFAGSEEELINLESSTGLSAVKESLSASPDMEVAEYFYNTHGYISVSPVWKINNQHLLSSWRNFLLQNNLLIEEHFDYSDCKIFPDSIKYKNLHSKKIIFCEGVGALADPFLKTDSFVKNRGDVLIIRIPGFKTENIFQKDYRLIPLGDELFWLGSNYRWSFETLEPDAEWRTHTEKALTNWLKLPFKVESHLAAERPTTAGQQVFASHVGNHQHVFWLNGLGTKGFTIAPAVIQNWLPELIS
ncbi:FAD-dependent oxidoreductase [Pollutibacter soli]|uniref:NAD(P)/FAD-dependent oxidoreductase n=1 Tax=Pollutibacter soli TaxID=3034157 RepID=UPI0030137C4D